MPDLELTFNQLKRLLTMFQQTYSRLKVTEEMLINLNTLIKNLEGFEDTAFDRNVFQEQLGKVHGDWNNVSEYSDWEAAVDELGISIHSAIEENNMEVIEDLLKVGDYCFKKGLTVNEKHPLYNTPLIDALLQGKKEIAIFLLEHGARVNKELFTPGSPLYVAIKANNTEMMEFLIERGAKIRVQNSHVYPSDYAIQTGQPDALQVLINHGLKLNLQESFELAISCKQPKIILFLFNEIKRESLKKFLKSAPLKLLQAFMQDSSISVAEKLATPITTKRAWRMDTPFVRNSGTLLLMYLLEKKSDGKDRIGLIKLIIKQAMMLNYALPEIEDEACYKDFDELDQLAQNEIDSPVRNLAQQIINSIDFSSIQQKGYVGERLLLNVVALAKNKKLEFSPGINLIENTLKTLKSFLKTNRHWPNEEELDKIIQRAVPRVNSAPKVNCTAVKLHTALDQTETLVNQAPQENPEPQTSLLPQSNLTANKRFQAMAGSAVFASVYQPKGGLPHDAAVWYWDILSIIVDVMSHEGMLDNNWDKDRALRLLTEVCEYRVPSKKFSYHASRLNALKKEDTRAIGMMLEIPKHFVPVCLFKKDNHWVYSLMCRSFIYDAELKSKCAVDLIIPTSVQPQLIINEVLKRGGPFVHTTEIALDREITYRLLTHLRTLEKITGTTATYSERSPQKSYKGNTCYVSNIKLLLPLLLEIMAVPDISTQQ